MVRSAIERDGVQARRVGHGIEARKDPGLLRQLQARSDPEAPDGVCLEICPVSNRRLGYLPGGLATHPLCEMHKNGVACALSSDDPSFFGSRTAHGLLREFVVARHIMKLDDEALAVMARHSIDFSIMGQDAKTQAHAAINTWLAAGSP